MLSPRHQCGRGSHFKVLGQLFSDWQSTVRYADKSCSKGDNLCGFLDEELLPKKKVIPLVGPHW